jgi:hypothetical protein
MKASDRWTKRCFSARRLCVRQFVQFIVSVIKAQVDADHDDIDHIKHEHVCDVMRNDLSGNAAYVAHPDQTLEQEAFPLGRSGFDGLIDGQRPGKTETDDHCRFKYLCHFYMLPFFAQLVALTAYQKTGRIASPRPVSFLCPEEYNGGRP